MDNATLRGYLSDSGMDIRTLAYRYSKGCWQSWKEIKTKALDNPENPFTGSPEMVVAKGITEVAGINGPIPIAPTTRIRLRQLAPAGMDVLGIGQFADKTSMGGNDVVHPEFTETFEDCVAKSQQYLMNNYVAAATVLETIVSFLAGPTTTVVEMIEWLRPIAESKPDAISPHVATMISLAVRCSWIGRVCIDGSYKDPGDFVFYHQLAEDVAAIDPYVAAPVIKMFIQDLERGNFNDS